MPLLDNGAEFVASESHTVEIGQANFSLDLFADQTELPEICVAIIQIAKRNLVDSSL